MGGACSFAPLLTPTRLRLLPSSPRADRSLRLPEEAVVCGSSSAFPEAGGTESGRGSSSEGGAEVGAGSGVGAALADGAVGVAFKLTFLLCQRPCMDLLRALGPWLTCCEDCNRHEGRRVVNLNGEAYRYLHDVLLYVLGHHGVQNVARQDKKLYVRGGLRGRENAVSEPQILLRGICHVDRSTALWPWLVSLLAPIDCSSSCIRRPTRSNLAHHFIYRQRVLTHGQYATPERHPYLSAEDDCSTSVQPWGDTLRSFPGHHPMNIIVHLLIFCYYRCYHRHRDQLKDLW